MTTGAAVLASAHCHGALRARGSARPTSEHFLPVHTDMVAKSYFSASPHDVGRVGRDVRLLQGVGCEVRECIGST